tara:strand:+ start:1255 stop:1821 length:567 start_codon:yes stop_codon:yes gene_type:complete
MAYTHAYMMKKNLMDIEHMARRTNGRLSTTDRVMPWESDLISQAATNMRSVYRYRKYKDRFGHTHRPKTPFLSLKSDGYGGCGTFFGWTKDPVKRACVLEKYIAKHEPKCNSGKQKSCNKVAKHQAELAAITGNTQIAQGTAADFYYQQAVAYEQQAAAGMTTQKGPDLIPIAAVGAASLVLLYALVQ